MKSARDKNKILLVSILVLIACVSNFCVRKGEARAMALDAFLKTLPGRVLLSESTTRSLVFFNSADLPSLNVEYARKRGLPANLVAQIFELEEGVSVPIGLENAEYLPNDGRFRPELPGNNTLVFITPIALNGSRDEALFGTTYTLGEEEIVISVVWMKKDQRGHWNVEQQLR